MAVQKTGLAAALAVIIFLVYLRLVVPLVEGQSADRVPEIDLLGVLRVEQPGQWMSLFPSEAWQRDESNRNIIHADGNIVLFRDYQHEADGTMRVRGLTLLLFDQEQDDLKSAATLAANDSMLQTANNHSLERPCPVVVEAIDDAILTFDAQKSVGLNRYGDLKQVQFTGEVKFWRASTSLKDRFEIQTRELIVNGGEAITAAPVAFQFGSTNGLARGLHLTFENSGSLHSASAALTKIVGVRHMRLQHIERLEMLPEGAAKPIVVTCSGPGEFSFRHLSAKLFDQIRIQDQETGYEIWGEAVQVRFRSEEEPSTDATKKTPRLFPEQMTAQDFWVYGPPAMVVNPTEQFALRSTVLHYAVDQLEFVAGPLPDAGVEPWMMDATIRSDGPSPVAGVEVAQRGLQMWVPKLRYRSTKKTRGLPKPSHSDLSDGEFVGTGPGKIRYLSSAAKEPLELEFGDRVTAHPDQDDPNRWLISILGNTNAKLDAKSTVFADALYVWLHSVGDRNKEIASAGTWEPDLLLAQGRVRMLGEKVRAAVSEARVYFPAPRVVVNEQPRPESTVINSTVPTAIPDDNANVNFEESVDDTAKKHGDSIADVTADTLIVQLDWNDQDAPLAAIDGSKEHSELAKYRMTSIDLDGNVIIVETEKNASELTDSARLPRFQMFGDRIVGVASGSVPASPTVVDSRTNRSPEFVWTLAADADRTARLLTPEADLHCPELHYDQTQQIAWANKPGTISFTIPSDLEFVGPQSNGLEDSGERESGTGTGRGSAKWQKSLQFNGRDFALEGQVQLEIEQPKDEVHIDRLQAYGERVVIELSEPINMGQNESNLPPRSAKRIALFPGEPSEASGEASPVRLYHQQRTRQNELVAQDVVWSTGVELEPKPNQFRIQGPGSLWSMRYESQKNPVLDAGPKPSPELVFLKVQFQRTMEGKWSEGQIHLFGPVSALYGKAPDWQVIDQESRLLDPLRITSDSMTINRWKKSADSQPELEWEADGRVHVVGSQFEGNAQRITYSQSQDLLTLRGDGRAPAKFWQINSTSSERNHLAAQEIWYRPKLHEFDFVGFQEGNLNFFSGRRGGISR
ncbi:MAG: hypothetical protein JNL67_09230 [Planctomycetaceae bacterium]|nr:hypothetical protein [Planctomycetaceae bacterium]